MFKSYTDPTSYFDEDIDILLHKIVFHHMLEFPKKFVNKIPVAERDHRKYLVIAEDNRKSWHSDPANSHTRLSMLVKIAEVVYRYYYF